MTDKKSLPGNSGASEAATLERSIPFLLHRISDVFAKKMLDDLRPYGLSVAKWRVLSSIKSCGEMTIGELAAFIGLQQPVASRVVSEMEAEKLLRRKSNKKDHRFTLVSLSRSGERLFAEVLPFVEARREQAVSGLTKQQRRQMIAIVHRMESNLGIR